VDIQDLVTEVASLRTKEDLSRVYDAAKVAQNTISNLTKLTFAVGDRVSFTGKRGSLIEGSITKINRKNILVQEEMKDGVENPYGMRWTVSPTLLEKATV